jgi:hypothetical protein
MAGRVLLVVGSERSGTSLLVGVLRALGWNVPQPEWPANEMNPRGFGEPEWVVRFDMRALEWANVHISDARPQAWSLVDDMGTHPSRRRAMVTWLGRAMGDDGRDVVVKDPRLTWLLPSWTEAVRAAGAEPLCLVAARKPAEVVASKMKVNPARREAGGLAGWVNVTLRAERVSRDLPRAFVTYHHVLEDWRGEVDRMGASLGAPLTAEATPDAADRVSGFLDPTLHRRHALLGDLDAPRDLVALAENLWELLLRSRESTVATDEYDALRERYDHLYARAEAVAESSIGAANRRYHRLLRRTRQEADGAGSGTADPRERPPQG